MMLISIVINNYNYGRFLADAIESALAQDYPAVEVIVVDDGSTDNSRQVITNFGDKVTCIFKDNGGQGSALNAGFAVAHGDMVIFLDADDALMSDCCSTIAAMWRDDVVKVHFNLEVIDQTGKKIGNYWGERPLPTGSVVDQVLRSGDYPSMPMSGNAFHRRYLEQVMPMTAERWRRGADVFLYIQAPFFGSILSTNKPLGHYRMHGTNISAHVKDGRLRVQSLNTYINREKETDALIELQAVRSGQRYDNVLIRGVAHRQLVFLSARFSPKSAAIPAQDKATASMFQFLMALSRDRGVNPVKKFLIGLWMSAILCVPSRLAEKIFVMGYRRGGVFAVSRFVTALK